MADFLHEVLLDFLAYGFAHSVNNILSYLNITNLPISYQLFVVYPRIEQFQLYLTLSLAAPFGPPCLEALGLIGPRKKGEKTGFYDVS